MSIQVQIEIGGETHTLVFPPDTPEQVIQQAVEQYQAENDPDRPSQFDMVTAQQRAQADQAKVQTMGGIAQAMAQTAAEVGALRQDLAALTQTIAQSNQSVTQAVGGLTQAIQQAAQMVTMAMTLPKTIESPDTGKRFEMSIRHDPGR